MTMIEEIGKALFAFANRSILQPEKIEALWPSQSMEHWGGLALAALKALQEPSLDMQNAGWREVGKQGFETEDTEVAPIFRVMIDAAIAEHEGRE